MALTEFTEFTRFPQLFLFRDSPPWGKELINKDGNPVNSVNHVIGWRE